MKRSTRSDLSFVLFAFLVGLVLFVLGLCMAPKECAELCGARGVAYFDPGDHTCVCATRSACPGARP